MKPVAKILAALLLAVPALLPLAVQADEPGHHPHYLHALSDLRSARWLLDHKGGGWEMREDERSAVREIDAAINDIKRAAINDGKNLEDHPSADTPHDRDGALHRALELLRSGRADIAREEDDQHSHGLRDRALGHIDSATHSVERSMHAARHQ